MNDNKKLCPFKKKVVSERNPNTGRTTIYEKFEVCAGERCMAYDEFEIRNVSQCKRLPPETNR